nr:ephrin-B1 [Drosophila bipectinata]
MALKLEKWRLRRVWILSRSPRDKTNLNRVSKWRSELLADLRKKGFRQLYLHFHVNKGNLAFEFDQVHIICPVYEPGTFDNETEKYIIYNVSKVEYETCRITNADPRVIAICDKPRKLMFFTITFRPFTPQPGGLEFLPGNDYYFISTSSKDDLYRRIGGRCSTNNMKVVFKVCCATEEKNKTSTTSKTVVTTNSPNVAPNDVGHNNLYGKSMGQGNNIGISGVSSGIVPPPSIYPPNGNSDVNINGIGTSINTNLD